MTMQSIDKAACATIGEAAITNLAAFCEEHGLSVARKGGTYDPSVGTFTLKLEFSLGDSERLAFERDCMYFDGIEPSDYNREFRCGTKTYTLIGFAVRSPKRPLLAKDANGKTFKFTEDAFTKAKALA